MSLSSFVCTQLNSLKYYYPTLIILFSECYVVSSIPIYCLLTIRWFQVLLFCNIMAEGFRFIYFAFEFS